MRVAPTEAETQKAILDLLTAKRIFAFRMNTAAFKAYKRFFRAHSLGAGAADIFALPTVLTTFWKDSPCGHELIVAEPHPVWIEVKSPTGKQTPQQKNFQQYVEEKGFHYLLARSVDDVSAWLKKRGL